MDKQINTKHFKKIGQFFYSIAALECQTLSWEGGEQERGLIRRLLGNLIGWQSGRRRDSGRSSPQGPGERQWKVVKLS